jgi:CRISPR/Cas system-associated protein Csm6
MDQRSKTILTNVLSGAVLVAVIAGLVAYFQHRPFHWWVLIAPVVALPLKVMYFRRQKHWDDLAAKRAASNGATPEI